MQWGMNKGVTPYAFGANINGSWSNLGTTTPAGVWTISPTTLNVSGIATFTGGTFAPGGVGSLWGLNVYNSAGSGLKSVFVGNNSTWPETVRPPSVSIASLSSVSNGFVGILAASRTSDNPLGAGTMGTIGFEAVVLNDKTSALQYAWGSYIDVTRGSGGGTTHGQEIDTINRGSTVDVTTASFPMGLTAGSWLSCGGGWPIGETNPCSAALVVLDNPQKFRRGIVFRNTALDGVTATTGTGPAITLARGHRIDWLASSGSLLGYIYADGTNTANSTGLKIDNFGFLIGNAGEYPVYRINNTFNGVNYGTVESSVSGTPVIYRAEGTDANVGIKFIPKGTGAVSTTSPIGIGVDDPNEPLEVANAVAPRAIVSDGQGANRRGLLLVGPVSGVDYGRVEAFKYGTGGGGKPLGINTSGGGNVGVGMGQTAPTAALDVAESTTARASIRVRSGVAPTAPNDGDMWFDGTHVYMQIGGVAKQLDN